MKLEMAQSGMFDISCLQVRRGSGRYSLFFLNLIFHWLDIFFAV
jgi:hypothetical protein